METKQAFANICERIWKQVLSEDELEPEIEASMRRVVAQLAMIAWNTCNTSESLSEAKEKVVAFAKQVYPENDNAANPLLNAVSIKWHDYRDDRTLIASSAVEIVDGNPRAIAYLKGELPAANEATSAFRSFMESPEVQEHLKHVPPEKLNEEIGKLIEKYNASLPSPSDSEEEPPDEFFDYPLSREVLEKIYKRTLWSIPSSEKMELMKLTLKEQPFLASLCKGYEDCFRTTEQKRKDLKTKKARSSYPGSIPEMVLTISSAYAPTVDYTELDDEFLSDCTYIAIDLLDSLLDQDDCQSIADDYEEPDLIEFIYEHVVSLGLPQKEFKKTLKALLVWACSIGVAREAQAPEEEDNDFDQKNLKALQLKVDFIGHDVTADMLVREDMTFAELGRYIAFMFDLEDGHLYRFDCDDGCLAIHPDEDTDEEDVIFSDVCYVGHHLTLDDGADFVFDYGEENEFRITVDKIMKAKGLKCPQTISMTKEPPFDWGR